jgi:hypothetical protein
VSPTRPEIFDHDIDYSYDYTLIVGTLDEIRAYVYDHARRPGPPSYRFRDDRRGWIYHDARDGGMPIKGELRISPDGEDPQLIAPAGFWKAADARTLYIEAAVSASSPRGQVFWSRFDAPGFSADRAADVSWKSDGQYHLYRVKLSESAGYRGIITGLRLDPVNGRDDTAVFRIRSIGFAPPGADGARKNPSGS